MAIQVELLEFLRTGDFGGITLGTTRQQIIDLLGKPPNWMVTRRKKRFEISNIWRYGSIEFYFADFSNVMHMIFTDHFPLEGSDTLTITDPWLLRGDLTLNDAQTLLTPTGLSYQVAPEKHTGLICLTFASGVKVSFESRDEGGPLELSAFWLSTSSE